MYGIDSTITVEVNRHYKFEIFGKSLENYDLSSAFDIRVKRAEPNIAYLTAHNWQK